MTRKDYVLIANALNIARVQICEGWPNNETAVEASRQMHRHCTSEIAEHLERNNPRFDRDRFLKAAGVER